MVDVALGVLGLLEEREAHSLLARQALLESHGTGGYDNDVLADLGIGEACLEQFEVVHWEANPTGTRTPPSSTRVVWTS